MIKKEKRLIFLLLTAGVILICSVSSSTPSIAECLPTGLEILDNFTDDDCDGWINGANYNIRSQHPRIFITSSDITTLKCKAGIPGFETSCSPFASHKLSYDLMKQKADWLLTQSINTDPNPIPVLGLTYLITDDTRYSINAINRLIYFVDNLPAWFKGVDASDGDSQQMLFWMMRVAISYDWLHEQLTKGIGSQKEKVANFIADYFNPARWNSRQFSDWSNLAMLAYGTPLIGGVAVFGDGVNDLVAEDIISEAKQRLEARYLPARELAAGPEGGFSEGFGYADYAGAFPLTWILEAWRTASGINKFTNFIPLQKLSEWFLYFTRPYDNTWERIQEGREYIFANQYSKPRRYFSLIASRYTDGYAQYIAEQYPYLGPTSYNTNDAWTDILWHDPSITAKPPSILAPSTKLFGTVGQGGKAGLGWSVFRSGFSNRNDIFATFIAGDHYGAHWLRSQNAFTIHKNNSLAIASGYYAQWDNLGDQHKLKYYYHPISKNTLVFTNNSGKTVGQNDWGDPWESRDFYSLTQTGGEHDTADLLKFEDTANYSYTQGDATIAYSGGSSSNGDKNIKLFQREFMYLKPDYFIIFDRIKTTDSSYKKRWLLHSINEPQVNGTFTSGTAPNPFGGTPGYTSSDSDLVIITNGAGKLFSKTLLPLNPKITKIGGSDSSGKLNTIGSYDFYIDGVNYPTGGPITTGSESGAWRVEISPSTPQNFDNFLHVLYPTEAITTSMPETILIKATNMTGALIQDSTNPYIALFSKTEISQDSVTYDANYLSFLTGKHLLADMSPGTYDIYKNGAKILSGLTASSQGTLYFESTGGSTFQVGQTGTTPPDTTAPTGTISINAGATYTNSTTVTLSLSATDSGSGMGAGAQMQFSNDNTNWSTPEAYATSKSWTLSNGDGLKTVYAKFKDVAGNWMSTAVSDTIILDTAVPGDVNGDGYVNVQDVQACVNHILGTQNWGSQADVNADDSVNVLDVQKLVNVILEE